MCCVGVCVGWVGLGCVDVWAGWQSLLIDVAAPQRGDQVKQVLKKDLAKTATNNLFNISFFYNSI